MWGVKTLRILGMYLFLAGWEATTPLDLFSFGHSPPSLSLHKPLNPFIGHNLISSPPSEYTPFNLSTHDVEGLKPQYCLSISPSHPFSSAPFDILRRPQRSEARGVAIHREIPPSLMDRPNGILRARIGIRPSDLFVFLLCYLTL